jgi:hypothetical protein
MKAVSYPERLPVRFRHQLFLYSLLLVVLQNENILDTARSQTNEVIQYSGTFPFRVPTESIHPREGLSARFALEGSNSQVYSRVTLEIVFSVFFNMMLVKEVAFLISYLEKDAGQSSQLYGFLSVG